jgi:homoserine dehydrogenase
MNKIKAGLFGFGVVGEGIHSVLEARPNLGVEIVQVVIKHQHKQRNAPAEIFSTDKDSILLREDIALVIELIDDADAAYQIAVEAMNAGKSVISANKKMIAEHHIELIELAQKKNVSFLYEAAVCGSVPLIRNLEEYFDNDLVKSVTGIVNGSTNYILSQMSKNNLDYASCLKQAQELGFAESDPSIDVKAIDARNKLKIIALHAFGQHVEPNTIVAQGIESISKFDIEFAKQRNLVIKLIASCKVNDDGSLEELTVIPSFIPVRHPLRLTDNEYNGVLIGSQLADEQFFYGKGAGRYPTSSAVLSDISAFKFDYKYSYKKGIQPGQLKNVRDKKVYLSYRSGLRPNLGKGFKVLEKFERDDYHFVIGLANQNSVKEFVDNSEISVIDFSQCK